MEGNSAVRISIDYGICAGHGRCFMLAPALFEADDDGRGVVLEQDVPKDLEDLAQESSYSCPEQAILIKE
jgi:ferredoxin